MVNKASSVNDAAPPRTRGRSGGRRPLRNSNSIRVVDASSPATASTVKLRKAMQSASPKPTKSRRSTSRKRTSLSKSSAHVPPKSPDGHELYCDGTKLRPTFRGVMHLIWFATTPAWAWALLRQCDSPAAVISASIFMLGWALQYGFSALWHCWPWVNRSSEILANNLDHVGIFIMIAASYMVPCFTLLSETGQYFAVGLWSFALLGSLQTLGLMGVSRGDRRTIAACYVAQGALVVVSAEEMARKFTTVEMQWALLSLTQYALCALVYAFKRPDLLPLHWGYHECFHFLVCTGSVCTYLTHFNIVSRLAGQTAALGQ